MLIRESRNLALYTLLDSDKTNMAPRLFAGTKEGRRQSNVRLATTKENHPAVIPRLFPEGFPTTARQFAHYLTIDSSVPCGDV